MLRKYLTFVVSMTLIFFLTIDKGHCDNERRNPSRQELEQKVEEIARKRGIPSVILKSIARVESTYQQYNKDGTVFMGSRGSIGLMQIHNNYGWFDSEKLKYDIDYNIEAGADVLLRKWDVAVERLPHIGDMNPNVLENWYFAIWAYNGWSKSNNPNMNLKKYTYPELIYQIAQNEYGQKITPIDPKLLPKQGLPSKETHYDTPNEMHYGDILTYQKKDIVKLDGRSYMPILKTPNGDKVSDVAASMSLEIIEGPVLKDGYFWYKIKEVKTGVEGWLRGNWISKTGVKSIYPFDDIENIWSRDYILDLHKKGIISGEGESFNPDDFITRQEMSVLISKALELDGTDYQLTYADANEIKSWAVEHVKAVSKVGLFIGHGEFNLFNPNGYIAREDIAVVISKIIFPMQAYSEQDPIETECTDIDDVSEYALDAVKSVQAKGLMKGTAGKFRPKDYITREEACKLIFDILQYSNPESTD